MFNLSRAVPIVDLNITDKDFYGRLKDKGLKKVVKNKFGDFSYKCNDYLIYYENGLKRIRLMWRNPAYNWDYTPFGAIYYSNEGYARLGVEDKGLMSQFLNWLQSTQKAIPFKAIPGKPVR